MNGLKQPESLSVGPLQTKFDPVVSTFSKEEVLKQEENGRLWNPTVKHIVESLDKEDGDGGTAWYSSMKKPLFEYMEADSGRVYSAKR